MLQSPEPLPDRYAFGRMPNRPRSFVRIAFIVCLLLVDFG